MVINQHEDWRASYQRALLEVDSARLHERIEQACKAIQLHMDLTPQDASAERQALADALANLRVLRREVAASVNDANQPPPHTNGKQDHP